MFRTPIPNAIQGASPSGIGSEMTFVSSRIATAMTIRLIQSVLLCAGCFASILSLLLPRQGIRWDVRTSCRI
jgi:hypothetical protein